MQRRRKIVDLIDQFNERIGEGTSWLNLGLILLIIGDVITRQVGKSSVWVMELEWHIFALLFLLGAGYAYKHDRHVRVDLFYSRFSPRDQALINFWGNLLFLIPWCLVVIYAGWGYATDSLKIRETSPDPGGLPGRYLIKFSIVLGIGLLLLQAIADLIKQMDHLWGRQSGELNK